MTLESLFSVPCGRWRAALPDAEDRLSRTAAAVLRHMTSHAGKGRPRSIEVSFLLTDDAEMQELNAAYRGQSKPTNVLSFPTLPAEQARGALVSSPDDAFPVLLGDIALGFETVAREAEEQRKSLADHAAHLVVHGMLHLFGYEHEADREAEEMEALERSILAGLDISDPYAKAN